MKRPLVLTTLSLGLIFGLYLTGRGAEAASEHLIKAADNKIFAQKLVTELTAANPDLMAIGLHGMPPGGKDQVIIAQTDDIIGRKDSGGDLEVFNQDELKIYPGTLGGKPRMKVMVAYRDGAGQKLGLVVLSFKPGPGVTAFSVHVRTNAILAEIAKKVPNAAALYQPLD
jgi:hypothetical protein